MIQQDTRYLFLLAVLLIVAAYFIGVTTELATLGQVVGNIGYIFTGRNPATGQFANYPGQN